MDLDWLTTLGVADQSLEAQLARRDLSKKLAMVKDLAEMTQRKRVTDQEMGLREKALEEQGLLRRATQAQTQAYRDEMTRRANVDDERQDYNTLSDNLQRQVANGVAPTLDEKSATLMRKHGEGGAITDRQIAGSPPGEGDDSQMQFEHVYRQHEADVAASKAKMAEQIKAEQEKRAKRDQQIQERELKLREDAATRAENEEKRKQAREKDRQQAVNDKRKQLDASLKKLPPQLGPAVKKRAEEIISQRSSILDMLPWADKEDSVTDAWIEAYTEVADKAAKQGIIPAGPGPAVQPGPSGGRGGGSGQPSGRIDLGNGVWAERKQ